jgi:Tol biopolymer transport system component/DNA-binding winged helix-turn-helix (wHTH) protein
MHDLPKTSGWRREAPFRVGDLDVLPTSGELRSRRGTQRVRPLLMDILVRLAAEPGEVVRRETLLEDVWPRRMVNDEVLSRAIAELRTALGDDARGARYIETLPKLGYRLVAPVGELTAEPAPAQLSAANEAIPPAPKRSWVAPVVALSMAVVVLAMATAWLARSRGPDVAALEAQLKTARPFTSDPALEMTPRFSPDGKRVAFALVEGDDSRIVVQDVDGSKRQFVGGLEGYGRLNAVFFPDGRTIAYWKSDGKECAIVRHDLETGNEDKLLDCALKPRGRFDLSRDGRWLVFAGEERPQFPVGLWVMEIGGGAPVRLTKTEPGQGEDVQPRFSPDGERIVFFRGSNTGRTPWIVERGDPSSARPAAKMEGMAYGAVWLGARGPIIASGDWLGFRALNLIDPQTGEARLLGARGARFPDVGPNGELVFENATFTCNLWMLDRAKGLQKEPLWKTTRYSTQPEFSPDGRSITFGSNRDGFDAIYVAPFDGEPRRISFGEGFRYGSPHWSRDGRSIYATRQKLIAPGGAPIQEAVRIAVDGGAVELLSSLGQKVGDVMEGDDGRLYWGEVATNSMRVSRAPLGELKRAERLPLPLVSLFQVAGGRIVFTQPQLSSLTSCRLDTLACEPLAVEIRDFESHHWGLGPRSLFMRVRTTEGKPRLARYDFATRKLEESWDAGPSGAGTSIAVSPDESRVVITHEEPPAIDLMIAR